MESDPRAFTCQVSRCPRSRCSSALCPREGGGDPSRQVSLLPTAPGRGPRAETHPLCREAEDAALAQLPRAGTAEPGPPFPGGNSAQFALSKGLLLATANLAGYILSWVFMVAFLYLKRISNAAEGVLRGVLGDRIAFVRPSGALLQGSACLAWRNIFLPRPIHLKRVGNSPNPLPT